MMEEFEKNEFLKKALEKIIELNQFDVEFLALNFEFDGMDYDTAILAASNAVKFYESMLYYEEGVYTVIVVDQEVKTREQNIELFRQLGS